MGLLAHVSLHVCGWVWVVLGGIMVPLSLPQLREAKALGNLTEFTPHGTLQGPAWVRRGLSMWCKADDGLRRYWGSTRASVAVTQRSPSWEIRR